MKPDKVIALRAIDGQGEQPPRTGRSLAEVGEAKSVGAQAPAVMLRELSSRLGLADAGLRATAAITAGSSGSSDSAEIRLSDGRCLQWETVKELTQPRLLSSELAAVAGVARSFKQMEAIEVAALVRRIAGQASTDAAYYEAREWGETFLRMAPTRDVDMSDQRSRWDAFAVLEGRHPVIAQKDSGIPIAADSLVLVDTDGTRLVRVGWVVAHIVHEDKRITAQQAAQRLLRVGWTRRAKTGRIKATDPDKQRLPLGWRFFEVPTGWEDDQ